MTSTKVLFEGDDGAQLAARFEQVSGQPRATAIFAHCFTCTKDSLAASRVSAALAARGIATLRFDFTGLGQSDGEFENTSFSSNVEDLLHAAAWLEREHGAPSLLVGHSLGGAAALIAAEGMPSLRAVVTMGAPCQPEHVRHLLTDDEERIKSEGKAEVKLGGRSFTIKKQFLDDLTEQRPKQAIAKLGRPLLVMHAPGDETVPFENAEHIFGEAKAPKSLISLDGADHLLTSAQDAEWVADQIAAWTSRYLPSDQELEARLPAAVPPGTEHGVVVEPTGNGKFQHMVTAGVHRMLGDEPAAMGGDDTGPTPYQFLLAALGTCTSMTMKMYADRKKWPLESVRVELDHAKVHAADCEDCETQKGKVDEITRTIGITGPLDEEQRTRLMQIADKCPVHKTLHSEVKVRTRRQES